MQERDEGISQEDGSLYTGANVAVDVQEDAHDAGSDEGEGSANSVQKRIHALKRSHRKEIRDLHDRISSMESARAMQDHSNQYDSQGQPSPVGMTEEQRIQHAVRLAFGMREQEERQAKEQDHKAHVQKQYQRLMKQLDETSEKYDDFDEVVRGDAPYSTHVRDALLLVDNPGEVAYRLGKNPSELERISKLHPLDQAREVNKLSFSLMSGNHDRQNGSNSQKSMMGSLKENPAHASRALGSHSVSDIRARMKAGTWK